MTTLTARTMHRTVNGLGEAVVTRPTPDFLQAARNRREVIINTIRFFEQDGDTVAAAFARLALDEQDEIIANLQAANSASICPVCGRTADHDWQECARRDHEEWKAAQADRAAVLAEL